MEFAPGPCAEPILVVLTAGMVNQLKIGGDPVGGLPMAMAAGQFCISVGCAVAGQKVPDGITDELLVKAARRSTLDEFTGWTL